MKPTTRMKRLFLAPLAIVLMSLLGLTVAPGVAHAASYVAFGVSDGHQSYGFYEGSVVVNATNVKINGRIHPTGSTAKACVYVHVETDVAAYNNLAACAYSPNSLTFATRTFPYSGDAYSVVVTVCSFAPFWDQVTWQCGDPREII
ncbi:hypothetical protein [Micromonospora sp. NPDC001898]|uniref:hypothetical protein n=1 Tax=Micromonospora sp. NPDC001898 TaxID=3364221 RepID=UPI0036BD1E5A